MQARMSFGVRPGASPFSVCFEAIVPPVPIINIFFIWFSSLYIVRSISEKPHRMSGWGLFYDFSIRKFRPEINRLIGFCILL